MFIDEIWIPTTKGSDLPELVFVKDGCLNPLKEMEEISNLANILKERMPKELLEQLKTELNS